MAIYVKASKRAKAHVRRRSALARDIKLSSLIRKMDDRHVFPSGRRRQMSGNIANRYNKLVRAREDNMRTLVKKHVNRGTYTYPTQIFGGGGVRLTKPFILMSKKYR